MDIETRAAAEARQVLEYFGRLEDLGKYANEVVHEQKLTFLTLALVNFARREALIHAPKEGR